MSGYLTKNLGELWLVVPGFTDLLLTGKNIDDLGFSYTLKAQSSEATWDNPIPIDVEVQRWMIDGAVATTQGYTNREPSFQIVVSADTAADLAGGESALALRSGQTCLLRWVPPTGTAEAAASVFEIWTWHLDHVMALDDELRTSRRYAVRMRAKPWVRSNQLTTVAALPTVASPTTTLVDDCTSTTGWAGFPNAVTTSGGAVKETKSATSLTTYAEYTLSLTRTGAVSMTTTPFLAITMTFSGAVPTYQVLADNANLTKVASIGTTTYWQMPPGVTSFTTLKVSAVFGVPARTITSLVISIADISKTDSPGGVGSHKMLTRTLPVGGSVPTSGSIQISSPSVTQLGTVLVYTCPSSISYNPPMRQYRTSGATVTADSSAVSGFHETFVTGGIPQAPILYSIPAGTLKEGTYVVIARFIFAGAASFPAQLFSTDAPGTTTVASVKGTVSAAGAGTGWAVIGALTLPGVPRPPESQLPVVVQFQSNSGGSGTATLDELFLLDVTHGAISLINGSPFGFTNLWLDSPDVDITNNRPQVYYGAASDRSDAGSVLYNQVVSLGDHDLDPNGATIFTVTDGVNDAVVSGAFYHRWHTHAGD